MTSVVTAGVGLSTPPIRGSLRGLSALLDGAVARQDKSKHYKFITVESRCFVNYFPLMMKGIPSALGNSLHEYFGNLIGNTYNINCL